MDLAGLSLEIDKPPLNELQKKRPFLRWAGSKRSIIDQLIAASPRVKKKYIEPFAGAASLFFAISPKKALLSDINKELIDAYIAVKRNPKEIWETLAKWDPQGNDYYEVRETNSFEDPCKNAARFLYLNRFCYNGIYRTNSGGVFNVPKGSRTGNLLNQEQLLFYSSKLRNANLMTGDFAEILKENVKRDDFVYLDPPYPRNRESGEYGPNAFKPKEFPRIVEILNLLDAKGAKFLLSYPTADLPNEVVDTWYVSSISVKRHISSTKSTITEALVSNYLKND